MSTSLFTNQEALIPLSAQGADGSSKPAALSASVAPYPGAHLSFSGGGSPLHVVADIAGTYTVTISGTSQDGTALPVKTETFIATTPPPPQATAIVEGTIAIKGDDITTPADSGSATVTGNV